ncbi:hypothetical protein C8F01DRAFT_1056511 [Mycena amicta]|nr:hypothetical protein C8F01DRAFT_1056511 [Mycena amicta]
MDYGHAAARAYKAYGDPLYLDYAMGNWWTGRAMTISSADMSASKITGKSFALLPVSECGKNITGGTFHTTDGADTTLDSESTASFMLLSALLAEATSPHNEMYLQAALDSWRFINDNLRRSNNLVGYSMSAQADDNCMAESSPLPSSSGLTIEGLSVLYSITGNTTYLQL